LYHLTAGYLFLLLSFTTAQHTKWPKPGLNNPRIAVGRSPILSLQHFNRQPMRPSKSGRSIDDMLRNERNDKKRLKGEVKVLLLGQSESGKSTTLKREFTTYVWVCVAHGVQWRAFESDEH
jgi:hypothetical protein